MSIASKTSHEQYPNHVPDVNVSTLLEKVSNKLVISLLNSQMECSTAALRRTMYGGVFKTEENFSWVCILQYDLPLLGS